MRFAFLGVLIAYAAFSTRTYYWDGVLDALNIETVAQGHASTAVLFHPNHLLYSAFGYVLYRALNFRAIAVLQAFNIVASTAASALLYALAKRLTRSASVALFCLILFAFGATWWKFSTDANPYILSVLLSVATIWFATENPPRLWAAALCHVGAMLFHELAGFTYPAVIAAILLQTNRKLYKCAAYIAGTAVPTAAVYWACYSRSDHQAYPTLFKWLTSYASDSSFTRSITQIIDPYLTSYFKLFLGGKLSLLRDYFSIATCVALILCATALTLAIVLFRRPAAPEPQHRASLIILWAWLLPCAIFLACWDPGSAFHKLFLWPAMVLLIGAYIAPPRASAFIAVAIAIAAWNFGAFIFPHSHSSADPVLTLAQKIDLELPRDATIYYAAFSPDDWYLDYFAPGRNWVKMPERIDGIWVTTAVAQSSGYACFETTALDKIRTLDLWLEPRPRWALVNPQHNVRLDCLEPVP